MVRSPHLNLHLNPPIPSPAKKTPGPLSEPGCVEFNAIYKTL